MKVKLDEIKKVLQENAAIENLPEEKPGTAEQLQQFYNSKQYEEIKETVIRVEERLIQTVKPVIETIKNTFNEIKVALQVDPEIIKCYRIHKRTKKGRIRKKQMSRINKLIKRRIKTNGNMDKDAG